RGLSLRPRVLQKQLGKKNWDGCWSTWRPATKQEALESEKRKENRCVVATEPWLHSHWSGGVRLKLTVKGESETAACMSANVLCHRHSAWARMNFHMRSIRLTLGEYAGMRDR